MHFRSILLLWIISRLLRREGRHDGLDQFLFEGTEHLAMLEKFRIANRQRRRLLMKTVKLFEHLGRRTKNRR